MNEAMKKAWLEIGQGFGIEPTQDQLTVFLRTWTHAIKAEREECAKVMEDASGTGKIISCTQAAAAIRARGNT
jgi:hypothetical protein